MNFRDRNFADRREAGRRLAVSLARLRGPGLVVVAVPTGGVPVGYEVARGLSAPLDVVVARKVVLPGRQGTVVGAVAEGGIRLALGDALRRANVDPCRFAHLETIERGEIECRACRLRGGLSHRPLRGKTVVLVDDGVETGATAGAACRYLRAQAPASLVLAVPVAALDALDALRRAADDVVCLLTPPGHFRHGEAYRDDAPTDQEQVLALLEARAAELAAAGPALGGTALDGTGGGGTGVRETGRVEAAALEPAGV